MQRKNAVFIWLVAFRKRLTDNSGKGRIKNMCDVAERLDRRGFERGIEQGRVMEFISIRTEDGYSKDQIIDSLVKRFHMTISAAKKTLQESGS